MRLKSTRLGLVLWAVLLSGLVPSGGAQTPPHNGAGDLGGTFWQLVKFEGSDDTTLTPDDKTKYTVAFSTDGNVSVQIGCNRGHGTWKSPGPNQLEFGPLALTRAFCRAAALNEQIATQWQNVRSYTLKDEHLFLALMADGGIYEYEPMSSEGASEGVVKGTATYRERMALPRSAVFEARLVDTSKADATSTITARTRMEHPGNPPILFKITYDPAKIAAANACSVRGRIIDRNWLLFTTTQAYPVLT
jgi:heat shock protein HslJ